VLACVADAVGASEPEAVVQATVDAFGVVTSPVEPREVGVAGWDGPQVFGAVELTAGVVVAAVQPHRDRAGTEIVGESVVVVSAVFPVGVAVAVGADAFKWGEVQVASIGESADPDRAVPRV